jgi:hypothetical protein
VIAGREEAKNLAGKSPPPDSDPFSDAESGRDLADLSSQFATRANSRLKFQKRSELFLCAHNKTLSVAAIGVRNYHQGAMASQQLEVGLTAQASSCYT